MAQPGSLTTSESRRVVGRGPSSNYLVFEGAVLLLLHQTKKEAVFSSLCFLISLLDWIDPGEGKNGVAVLTSFQRE